MPTNPKPPQQGHNAMMSDEAVAKMRIAFRCRKPLVAYGPDDPPKEILIDLLTAAAVLMGDVPKDVCLNMLDLTLQWVRGESTNAPSAPNIPGGVTLN